MLVLDHWKFNLFNKSHSFLGYKYNVRLIHQHSVRLNLQNQPTLWLSFKDASPSTFVMVLIVESPGLR